MFLLFEFSYKYSAKFNQIILQVKILDIAMDFVYYS